jgi:hypothetical protein
MTTALGAETGGAETGGAETGGAVVPVVGVTEAEVVEGREVPIALVAVTVNVYAVPFKRLGTTTLVASLAAAVVTPRLEVTV